MFKYQLFYFRQSSEYFEKRANDWFSINCCDIGRFSTAYKAIEEALTTNLAPLMYKRHPQNSALVS